MSADAEATLTSSKDYVCYSPVIFPIIVLLTTGAHKVILTRSTPKSKYRDAYQT